MSQEFYPFQLERYMSIWENQVEYNLSESGVHPITLKELLSDDEVMDEFLSTGLGYPQTNGSIELRKRIAALYPGASYENVVVTTGAAQANFTSLVTLMEPGDEFVTMLPNYMQVYGIAQNLRLDIKTFSLREENGWKIDLDELDKVVSNKTKMIAITNPNNPTGHIMTQEERDAVVKAADRVGAWLLTDEVYGGAERLVDEITPPFWGDYDKVLAMGSLSKAYGLPGLRVGWVVSPGNTAEDIWSRQDYITICNTKLANKLGEYILRPEVRQRLIQRTRSYIRQGYENFESWLNKHGDLFSAVPPEAAAVVFLRYHAEINSTELVNNLIHQYQTYVVPGDHFGFDHHLRISYGLPADFLNEGLDRIAQAVKDSL